VLPRHTGGRGRGGGSEGLMGWVWRDRVRTHRGGVTGSSQEVPCIDKPAHLLVEVVLLPAYETLQQVLIALLAGGNDLERAHVPRHGAGDSVRVRVSCACCPDSDVLYTACPASAGTGVYLASTRSEGWNRGAMPAVASNR